MIHASFIRGHSLVFFEKRLVTLPPNDSIILVSLSFAVAACPFTSSNKPASMNCLSFNILYDTAPFVPIESNGNVTVTADWDAAAGTTADELPDVAGAVVALVADDVTFVLVQLTHVGCKLKRGNL